MTNLKQFASISALGKSITALGKATRADNLQTILVNISYQALQGNWDVKQFVALKDGNVSADFKKSLVLHMPVVFNKDTGVFDFSSRKISKILSKLGFELEEGSMPTWDEFAANYPPFNAVSGDKSPKAEDTIEKIAKNVADRLGKIGVENGDQLADILVWAAKSPSILAQLAETMALGGK